jgi:hypothetical protein
MAHAHDWRATVAVVLLDRIARRSSPYEPAFQGRIARRAICADRKPRVRRRAVRRIQGVVAGLAEAAERPEPEGGVVTAVRLHVIGDGRRRHAACLQTNPT